MKVIQNVEHYLQEFKCTRKFPPNLKTHSYNLTGEETQLPPLTFVCLTSILTCLFNELH